MGKVYTRLNHTLWHMAYIREYRPPPGTAYSLRKVHFRASQLRKRLENREGEYTGNAPGVLSAKNDGIFV